MQKKAEHFVLIFYGSNAQSLMVLRVGGTSCGRAKFSMVWPLQTMKFLARSKDNIQKNVFSFSFCGSGQHIILIFLDGSIRRAENVLSSDLITEATHNPCFRINTVERGIGPVI